MSFNNIPYLHVYKASAGSGKTHQLTGQYIRLLFSADNNFNHILAVTFTNKATDEMKSRIVKELHNLAVGEESGYLNDLKSEFGRSEKEIRNRSQHILRSILHNYSNFSISTIDSFFQQTMRAFTREMGITGGYKVEVDNRSFLPEIVDLMLNELDQPGNEDLMRWLLDFMNDRIEDNKTWKINDDIVNLSGNLFDERFITLSEPIQDQISDKNLLKAYKENLFAIIRNYEEKIVALGERGLSIIESHGLSYSDFKGKSSSQFKRFNDWANGEMPELKTTFIDFANNVESWYIKSTPPDIINKIESAYSDGLNDCVNEAIALYNNCTNYVTAKEILRFFNTLGILSDVNNRLQAYRRDSNMIFLSDTTELLNKIIADSDSPFVYEKIGSRLNHFMIDEFQDTSTMQWNNFRPLLQESLASGNYNLIVGDVKQSIYRWRNSDWRLLEDQLEKDFSAPSIQQHVLDTNWRSDGHIVTFNNKFFEEAATALQAVYNGTDEEILEDKDLSEKISNVYSQLTQQVAPIKDVNAGRVTINFIEKEKGIKWQDVALKELTKTLENLQDEGFRLKDIAILVRDGKEGILVSERLLQYKSENRCSKYKFDFISNEALLLKNSMVIKVVDALLKYINNPHEKTKQFLAIYEYLRFTSTKSELDTYDNYMEQYNEESVEKLDKMLSQIISLPLYELTEALFDLLKENLASTDTVYIQAFLDLVNEYTARKTADLDGFLMWWDEAKEKKSLFSPEDQDAIQLMTIHKSKGLQFGAVILPFADWTFEPDYMRSPILWCKPEVEPFNELGIVPVKYVKSLTNTIFKREYLYEKLFMFIDNLNLLYVAFTRPKHRLIVNTPNPGNFNEIKRVSQLLRHSVNTSVLGDALEEKEEKQDKNESEAEQLEKKMLTFNYGEPIKEVESVESDKGSKGDNDDKVDLEQQATLNKWESIPFRNRLKMRLSGIGYFTDDGSRDFGTLMHNIVSEINTLDDLDGALERRLLSGELTSEDKHNLYDELRKSLSLPQVIDWYSGNYRVLNEQEVLHPSMSFIRPDRVMIKNGEVIVVDYKFGELVESKYVKQVQRYLKSIRGMGYDNVKGYLFYVKLHKVVKV